MTREQINEELHRFIAEQFDLAQRNGVFHEKVANRLGLEELNADQKQMMDDELIVIRRDARL